MVSLTGLKHLAQVFPRNRRSLNSPIGGMARKAMHLARKETPRRRAGRKIDRRAAAWDRGRKMEIDRNQQPGTGADSADLIPDEISPPGRLKCLNSLYRPALPEGTEGYHPAASPAGGSHQMVKDASAGSSRRCRAKAWQLQRPYWGVAKW